MELIRIHGHLTLWGGGIHHAEIKTAVRAFRVFRREDTA